MYHIVLLNACLMQGVSFKLTRLQKQISINSEIKKEVTWKKFNTRRVILVFHFKSLLPKQNP